MQQNAFGGAEPDKLVSALLESTVDGILVVDAEGKITLHNAKFASMWGIPEDILATRDDDKAIAWALAQLKDPDAFVAKVKQLYRSQEESFDTLQFKDGRVFERFSRPYMVSGELVGRVWSFRDVTEKKKAEDALLARTADLEKMNAAMVGRELRMAEIKEENERLKKQSGIA